ncbi:hypothetical protein [Paraburkholderia strydomiana]|uniref:hypothetical protein n=1 Tax=Paraburkholderia strydomiana TaxID=1245417 RepID=UPI001BE97E0E|nr:hypothetical protein [Paraburkholderia strydomiana]MBT2792936.1 hypothetical protein [Paraburkholderia strydomiana]
MPNASEIVNEPVVVRLTLVSLTLPGMLEAEAVIGGTDGIAVLKVERRGQLSQCSTLRAPSSGVISRLAYRLADIGAIADVRVQRCYTDLPDESGDERVLA